MTLDQDTLRGWLMEDLARRGLVLDEVARWTGAGWDVVERADTVACVVVMRGFDPEAYVAGAASMARSLEDETAAQWMQSFTRTVFLVGEPSRVAGRTDVARCVAPDGHVGWFGPARDASTMGLRRLLRPLRGASSPPARIEQGSGQGTQIHVASAPVLEDFLVQVNHAVCEGVIHGAITPGRALSIARHDALDDPPLDAHGFRVRFAVDRTRLELRSYLVG